MEKDIRRSIRFPVDGRKSPVRACDLVFHEDALYVEVKTDFGLIPIPWNTMKGEAKHLLEEVKLEKEYN